MGCNREKTPAESRIGQRFGRLVITSITRHTPLSHGYYKTVAMCLCDCGVGVEVYIGSLLRGATSSCGCRNREVSKVKNRTHGLRRHPLYQTWLTMRSRCNNPRLRDYPSYGGRGIFVSARWRKFDLFLADMGDKPGPGYTLERINNDGPYAWWNCRWATRREQSRNQRTNRWITWRGQSKIASDWAAAFGVCLATFLGNIRRRPLDVAFEKMAQRSSSRLKNNQGRSFTHNTTGGIGL